MNDERARREREREGEREVRKGKIGRREKEDRERKIGKVASKGGDTETTGRDMRGQVAWGSESEDDINRGSDGERELARVIMVNSDQESRCE